jgi:uncharacterized iron-regulated protein
MPAFLSKFKFLLPIAFIAILAACAAIQPPVQEMSNARQSIKAAEEVGAQKYASKLLLAAKEQLQDATDKLEAGEYEEARQCALDAKEFAIKAHQQVISHNKKHKK